MVSLNSLKKYSAGKLLILIFILSLMSHAQTTYEPLDNDIYSFLSRLAQKGIIRLDDQIKPLNRKYIIEKLIEAFPKLVEGDPGYLDFRGMSELEYQELQFYYRNYQIETPIYNSLRKSHQIDSIYSKFIQQDALGRLRLFSYGSDFFKINIDPVFGIEVGNRDKHRFTHYWSGLSFYGYLSDFLGFSFDYRDNHESGKTIDSLRKFSPETGIVPISKSPNTLDYSEIHTTISTDWKWGSFTAGKDFLEWGYGESGKLVLSNKAPSFPFIRLDIYPVSWLHFNYIHGWLSSNVVDSNDVYLTSVPGVDRFTFRKKYFASHTLDIIPVKGLDISLGESIIYSDRFEISYFMPLMFFKLAEHYVSNYNNNAGDNSQFFFSVSSRNHIKNTHLYGTLLIDEISLENLFTSQKQRNQFGFSFGASTVDMPVENLTLTVEYTKIYPFVYSHYIPTETYENDSYLLGHWMGNNADQIYFSLNYRFIRGLQLLTWWQYIRKGEPGTAEQQIDFRKPEPPFLFGLRTTYSNAGLDLKYEIINNLFARVIFQTSQTKSEISKGLLEIKRLNELYFSFYYGL